MINRPSLFSGKRIMSFVIRLLVLIVSGYLIIDWEFKNETNHFFYRLLKGASVPLTVSLFVSVVAFVSIGFYSRNKLTYENRQNVILGINRIASIVNGLFIVIGIMLVLGIDPKEFLTSITLVAMAIALIFREYITNMISGLFIMFSERFKLGDVIKMGDQKGKIIDITLSNIVLQSEEDQLIFIPNNNAFTNSFQNLSNQPHEAHITFSLPFNQRLEIKNCLPVIQSSLIDYKEFINLDEIKMTIEKIEYESMEYKIAVPFYQEAPNVKKKLNAEILMILEKQIHR